MLVLFQPELRRALEQLGRGTKINQHRSAAKDEGQRTVDEIRRSKRVWLVVCKRWKDRF